MIRVLADGTHGPIGVLIDDPMCGRVLLDCGVGVTTAAAFAGVSLAGVRVWCSGTGPNHLDPAVPPSSVVADLPGATVIDVGLARRALLLPTSAGVLLHHPGSAPLPGHETATSTLAPPRPGRRVLVTGGSRSGKSALAETMLTGAVTYLATGPLRDDAEWHDRVRVHRERRPSEWETVESTDAATVLAEGTCSVLLDSIGTWLTAAMDAAGTWAGRGDVELATEVDRLVDAWGSTAGDVVAVTEEVGSGVVPATSAGRRFRDELGAVNARLAAHADEVWLVTCGIGQRLK